VPDVIIEPPPRLTNGKNVLLYGVPGSGKSHTINEDYCNDENRMERLVFHPDYTYSHFVGQILPSVTEGNVINSFTPGPFTRLLKKAYDNPGEDYYLIVEEINRGNAPAIFGEVFQLLDRIDSGESEYGISNAYIAGIVYGDESRKVRIPSNMSIIGTMNTSDQNVFTLDTAFQRRWNMRMIENDLTRVPYADNPILDTIPNYQRPYKWGVKSVCALLDDIELAIHQADKYENYKYRIGTIILHNDEDDATVHAESYIYFPAGNALGYGLSFVALLQRVRI
jgi:5-methylcytosine-specific restriction endonuclease McrBC GTP-binding regulatory subunit McrB